MTARTVLCLSVRQPYAWLIVNGHKPIENRTRRTRLRGKLLIHASGKMTLRAYREAVALARSIDPSIEIPSPEKLPRGGIVGQVSLAGCVSRSVSPWFTGPYGYKLRSASPLPFIPCKAKLFFFYCPE